MKTIASNLKTVLAIALSATTFGAFAQGTSTTTTTTNHKSESVVAAPVEVTVSKPAAVKRHVKVKETTVASTDKPAAATSTTQTDVKTKVDATKGTTAVTSTTTSTAK